MQRRKKKIAKNEPKEKQKGRAKKNCTSGCDGFRDEIGMFLEAGRPDRKCSVALSVAVPNLGDRQRLETPSHSSLRSNGRRFRGDKFRRKCRCAEIRKLVKWEDSRSGGVQGGFYSEFAVVAEWLQQ